MTTSPSIGPVLPEPPRRSALVWALALDAAGIVLLGIVLATLASSQPDPDAGFFDEPALALALLAGAAALVGGGVVAAVSLVRRPLTSGPGRVAVRLAVAAALVVPALAVVVGLARLVLDRDVPAELVSPLATLLGIAAVVVGARAPEPGRRGLLVVPFLVGVVALTFVLGEALVPH